MWKSKSDWGWCLGGAYFLATFQAGGAYSGAACQKGVYWRRLVYNMTLFEQLQIKVYSEFPGVGIPLGNHQKFMNINKILLDFITFHPIQC